MSVRQVSTPVALLSTVLDQRVLVYASHQSIMACTNTLAGTPRNRRTSVSVGIKKQIPGTLRGYDKLEIFPTVIGDHSLASACEVGIRGDPFVPGSHSGFESMGLVLGDHGFGCQPVVPPPPHRSHHFITLPMPSTEYQKMI